MGSTWVRGFGLGGFIWLIGVWLSGFKEQERGFDYAKFLLKLVIWVM